jgi:hypothetical protein
VRCLPGAESGGPSQQFPHQQQFLFFSTDILKKPSTPAINNIAIMEVVEVKTMRRFYIISTEQWRVVSIIIFVAVASIIPVGYHISELITFFYWILSIGLINCLCV